MDNHNDGVKTYIIEGLDCAHCAAKLEKEISEFENVEKATLAFATKQLKIYGCDEDLTEKIQRTADAMEEGITVIPKDKFAGSDEEDDDGKKELIRILVGAGIFAIGAALDILDLPMKTYICLYVIAYLLLGFEVIASAAKNILKGQVFDENFLMSIATIGAFCIGEYPEAVGVMLFYMVGEYFEDRAVNKSRKQIMDAVDLRPEIINLMEGEDVVVVAADKAKPGDRILVRPGDRIPLDGIVISGESRIDTSPVTGEPVPVRAETGYSAISGCLNISGQLVIEVEKPLSESMVTRILESVENAAANKPKMDKFISRFARVYTPIVVGIAVIVAFVLPFVIPSWHMFVDADYMGKISAIHGSDGTASIFTALTFLVISCPCALVLSVPLAFFSGIGSASKSGILFKGGTSIEALSDVKAVVMDKTGTITKGTFTVKEIVPVRKDMNKSNILEMAAKCEASSTHPIARSIIEKAEEEGVEISRVTKVTEVAGLGIEADIDGKKVLCGNRKLLESYGISVEENIAEGGTEVFVAMDGEAAGYLVISDTIKDDATEAVSKLNRRGMITAMLTGDTEASAFAIAEKVGIKEVYGRLFPEDKLHKLQEIRNKFGKVMFIGDGINDAPVLAGADVGAAMGSGADAAIEAADVVFMTSEVMAIDEQIEIAKKTRRTAKENVVFALVVKAAIMILGFAGFANMWLAVFADTGVALLCLLNSIKLLK